MRLVGGAGVGRLQVVSGAWGTRFATWGYLSASPSAHLLLKTKEEEMKEGDENKEEEE